MVCKNSPYVEETDSEDFVFSVFDPKTEEFLFYRRNGMYPENYLYPGERRRGVYAEEYYEKLERDGSFKISAEREFSRVEIYCIRTEDEQETAALFVIESCKYGICQNSDNCGRNIDRLYNNLVQDYWGGYPFQRLLCGRCGLTIYKLGMRRKRRGNVIRWKN